MFGSSQRRAFTLIELLVVIAIVAILAVVVVVTLNPAELLRQSRDANRLSDMSTLQDALSTYIVTSPGSSLGAVSTTYLSIPDPTAPAGGNNCSGLGIIAPTGWTYHCPASSTYKNTDSTGWIPIALTQLSSLPVDMVNASTGLYYSYTPSNVNGTYVLTALMESQKYLKNITPNTTYDWARYAAGSNYSLVAQSEGLVRNYLYDEGAGTLTYDASTYGDVGTFSGGTPPYWYTGKIWAWAAQLVGNATLTFATTAGLPASTTMSITSWVGVTAVHGNIVYLATTGYGIAHPGSWTLTSSNTGAVSFTVYSASSANTATGCATQYTTGANAWHFLAGTYDGTTVRVYLDGALCGSAPLSGQTLYTGGVLSSAGAAGTTVYFDDQRLYSRPIPPAEITSLYNASK